MICNKCGYNNNEKAMFCEKCGTKISEHSTKRFNPIYFVIISVCIVVLLGIGIWTANAFSPYNRQVKLGYSLMNEEKYEEAILAFDNAIQIDERKAKAYFGKAESLANNENITYETAEEIINTLNEGYKKTNDIELILYLKNASDIVKENGFEMEAEQILNGYFLHLPEDIKNGKVNNEDVIYSEFVKAYDFWLTWIYYQKYAEVNFEIEADKNYVRAVVAHEEINSKKELEDTIKKHFADKLAERYIRALDPQDKEGHLYINALYGGVGDPMQSIKKYDFEKISKNEYILKLTMYDYFAGEDETYQSNIICTMNNGSWVFGNYFENFESQLVGTWNYEWEYYGIKEEIKLLEDRSITWTSIEPGTAKWAKPTGTTRKGKYIILDSNAIEVKFDDSNKTEVYVFNTSYSFNTSEQVHDENGTWENTKYWSKVNGGHDGLYAYFGECAINNN